MPSSCQLSIELGRFLLRRSSAVIGDRPLKRTAIIRLRIRVTWRIEQKTQEKPPRFDEDVRRAAEFAGEHPVIRRESLAVSLSSRSGRYVRRLLQHRNRFEAQGTSLSGRAAGQHTCENAREIFSPPKKEPEVVHCSPVARLSRTLTQPPLQRHVCYAAPSIAHQNCLFALRHSLHVPGPSSLSRVLGFGGLTFATPCSRPPVNRST